MKNEVKNSSSKSSDIFLVLADEAENMMKNTSEAARKEAADETEKFLMEYEQKARQIIMKTKDKASLQASEIADRFKEAMMQRIEEASAAAMSQIMAGMGSKTEVMLQRLQQTVQTETRQAMADALGSKPESVAAKADSFITKPASKSAAVVEAHPKSVDSISPESFESWLTQ
jgi:hypothetical protein